MIVSRPAHRSRVVFRDATPPYTKEFVANLPDDVWGSVLDALMAIDKKGEKDYFNALYNEEDLKAEYVFFFII
jgi:hypothetical protein